jgi:hypothetical protein
MMAAAVAMSALCEIVSPATSGSKLYVLAVKLAFEMGEVGGVVAMCRFSFGYY